MAIWTGTVSVTNGDATVTVDSGDALNQFNCTADSMVVIDGVVYFVLSRTDTTTFELTRNYAGSTGTGVAAEISPINQTTASLLTLSASASRLASQLDIFNKTGPWFFYTLIGATGDTDPGAGNVALSTLDFGSLSVGDAMSVYLDNVDGKDRTISGLLDTLVAGTIITIQSLTSTSYVSMQLTTGVVDGTGYRKSDATYIGHDGVLSAAEPVFIGFARVGQGLEIDAQGAFADRDDYDAEAEGFMYYSVDGDGITGIGTLYRKASNTSGDWSVGGVLQGTQGPQGEQGEQGVPGNDGADGEDGASAYEVAVAEGFAGTVTEWLASLEGDDGADGTDGADGADGTDPGFLYSWNTGTSNSDLGSGYMWADTTIDAATKLFVSKTNRAGDDLSQALADAVISTNTRKANLVLTRSSGNAQARIAITGLVDHTGYVEFTIASSSHAGATGFDLNDAVSLQINQIGNQGSVGPGGGDIVGPESSTIGNLLKWVDDEGTEAEDSGIAATNVALNSDNLASLENKTEAIDNLSLRGTAIASATTTDIGAATGRFVHITGTTTITGFGTADAGVEREVVFDGALTLTHNATSLILPGGANITTAAGDSAIMISEGEGNWRCIAYTRKSGKAVVPPAFSEVTGKPTTLDGYGVTDAARSFGTRAAAIAYNPPSSGPAFTRIEGYAAAGDGGGALYKLVGSEPSHDGKYQDAAGNWYEIAEATVTPQMFGAVADGSTDDEPAFTSAIAALKARSGGRLHIPAGEYAADDTITIDGDNITVSGDGMYASVIKRLAGGGSALDGIIIVSACSHVVLENFGLDGNRSNQTNSSSGIRGASDGVSDLTVRSVRCVNWGTSENDPDDAPFAAGAHFYSIETLTIENCEFGNNGHYGCTIFECTDVTIRGNRSHDNLRHGFGAAGMIGFLVAENFSEENGVNGIWYRNCEDGQIIGNHIRWASVSSTVVRHGIILKRSTEVGEEAANNTLRNVLVSNNYIDGASDSATSPGTSVGVYVIANAGTADNVQIVDNYIVDCDYGFYAPNGDHITVQGNQIKGAKNFAIWDDGISYYVCRNNLIKDCLKHGIYSRARAPSITGNIIQSITLDTTATYYGIWYADRTDATIAHNEVGDFNTTTDFLYAIYLEGAFTNRVKVFNNALKGTGTAVGKAAGYGTSGTGNTEWDNYVNNSAAIPYADYRYQGAIYMGTSQSFPSLLTGTGTPEGAVTARIGSIFMRQDGGAGTSIYVKQSGTGNTGWVGK